MTLIGGAATASAAAITVNGGYTDWFGALGDPRQGLNQNGTNGEAYNGAVTGYVNGISYWEETGVGPGGAVTPGYGGAPFDIRGLYAASDSSNYYFAAVVGMGPEGVVSGGTLYVMGDILIGDAAGNAYGIVTNSTDRIPSPGFTPGSFGTVSTANINDRGYGSSNPVFVSGFSGSPTATPFQYVNIGTDLWFIETSVSRTLFASGITGIHLTESCGNDVANLASVPEPGTMMLLGSGLLGLALYRRTMIRK